MNDPGSTSKIRLCHGTLLIFLYHRAKNLRNPNAGSIITFCDELTNHPPIFCPYAPLKWRTETSVDLLHFSDFLNFFSPLTSHFFHFSDYFGFFTSWPSFDFLNYQTSKSDFTKCFILHIDGRQNVQQLFNAIWNT